ncbi:hypothetical protein AC579_6356 [Pseudocercospora musae]|uniref:Uncharacterized protein n=1 Tax=Pseudocercospora musae TaxID=113226 RepID=A0A139H0Y5_9PEZI|nr:hypothetical protein AC579_6356 [Pseudocercospora musae]
MGLPWKGFSMKFYIPSGSAGLHESTGLEEALKEMIADYSTCHGFGDDLKYTIDQVNTFSSQETKAVSKKKQRHST